MDVLMNRKCIAVQIVKDKEVETEDEVKQRQALREEILNIKYPLIIGNVDKLNSQMSQLERNTWNPHPLVCEENIDEKRCNSNFIESVSDIQKINGRISARSSCAPKKTETNSQKSNGGPRFIETYQCPSFQENDETPLPHNVSPKEMLEKALKAHYSPGKVPFRPTFDKFLYSQPCQDILRDIFWHLFLSHFQSIPTVQKNLFHQVSKNYVSLLHLSRQNYFTDSFFRELPFLMPQAIYAAFLHCFADSAQHFDCTFKETTIRLVWLWMTGVSPSPGIWKKWNCQMLEPDNMIISESKLGNRKSKSWNSQENDQNLHDSQIKKTTGATTADIQQLSVANEESSGSFPKHFTRKEDFVSTKDNAKDQLSTFEKNKKLIPNLVKTVFNVNGSCPLVQHFLQSQNAELHAGTVNRVTRTQRESKPPSSSH